MSKQEKKANQRKIKKIKKTKADKKKLQQEVKTGISEAD
jgi:hypothetical protein